MPKLKHAPINLGKQLEDYLMDPDFEINRRQYLAEQESKKGKTGSNGASKSFPTSSKSELESRAAAGRAFPDNQPSASKPAQPAQPAQPAKGPDPDLIDFFGSIEQNQQPMAAQPSQGYQQQGLPQFNNGTPFQGQSPQFQNGFNSQPTGYETAPQFQQQQNFNTGINPVPQPQQPQPIQPNFTGAGFGGVYTAAILPAWWPTIHSPRLSSFFPTATFPAIGVLANGGPEYESIPSVNDESIGWSPWSHFSSLTSYHFSTTTPIHEPFCEIITSAIPAVLFAP